MTAKLHDVDLEHVYPPFSQRIEVTPPLGDVVRTLAQQVDVLTIAFRNLDRRLRTLETRCVDDYGVEVRR